MNNDNSLCYFFYFNLIVTGECEEEHLPKLFRSLLKLGCRFKVIHRIPQLNPITSVQRLEKMVGSGQLIPSKDEDIGIKIRIALKQKCSYVLIIDDLEHDRIPQAREVFQRYRDILKTMLEEQDKDRASIHFLVNMLEAYYFADTTATNAVLGTSLEDYDGDVEEIRHPKNDLDKKVKELNKNQKDKNRKFKEKEDGGKILELLNVEKILENPETCASLRTIFAWCMKRMGQEFDDRYQLKTGKLNEITKTQIEP